MKRSTNNIASTSLTISLRNRAAIPVFIGWLVGISYFGIARGFENFFPFTVLDMYAPKNPPLASRLLALDGNGQALETRRFVAWTCEKTLRAEDIECPELRPYERVFYAERDVLDYVQGSGALPASETSRLPEPISLVRRVYRLNEHSGPPPHQDCVLSRCRATRR